MDSATLAGQLPATSVIDLGLSRDYNRAHIPGACWCTRLRLTEALARLQQQGDLCEQVVLTSGDGLLAMLALPEARAWAQTNNLDLDIQALSNGTDAWISADLPTTKGLENIIGPIDDVWFKPYDHQGSQEQFMRDYLTWEVALVEQIERDGTTRFREF